MSHIEKAGRVCYKSEDKITEASAETFISSILKRGHESVIEHVSVTTSVVKLITNYSNGKISVKVWNSDNTSINKVLEVDEYNNLIISGIDNEFDIKEGLKVTTSGLSDIYPSGITIGTIEKIEEDKFGISKKAYIKHAGNLDNIRFVSVLIRG